MVTTPFPGPHARVVDIAVDGAGRLVAIGVRATEDGRRHGCDGGPIQPGRVARRLVRDQRCRQAPIREQASIHTGGVRGRAVGRQNRHLRTLHAYHRARLLPRGLSPQRQRHARQNVQRQWALRVQGPDQLPWSDEPRQRVGSEERLVVAGQASRTGAWRDFKGTVWRLTAAGVLDASFGVGGVATVDFEGEPLGLGRIAVDGPRLVVAGSVSSVDDIDYSYWRSSGSMSAASRIPGSAKAARCSCLLRRRRVATASPSKLTAASWWPATELRRRGLRRHLALRDHGPSGRHVRPRRCRDEPDHRPIQRRVPRWGCCRRPTPLS